MRLAHLHLPNPISYTRSLRLQEVLLEKHFAYNAYTFQNSRQPSTRQTVPEQPPPTLLTFQANPVYTVGRRHLKSNPLSQSQVDFLTTNHDSPTGSQAKNGTKLATFYPSPRGGLLTYHAPGQMTAYLILNLRTHGITPRCFIRMLENTVIRTCARYGVSNALTTEDPGVWIGVRKSEEQEGTQPIVAACGGSVNLEATTRKICAIGVHVTRGITSHGIGLNVSDVPIEDPSVAGLYTLPSRDQDIAQPAPGYLSWGFSRIIACGLEGKSVTWLSNEGAAPSTRVNEVADGLAEEVCNGLTSQGRIGISGIDHVQETDVLNDTLVSETVDLD